MSHAVTLYTDWDGEPVVFGNALSQHLSPEYGCELQDGAAPSRENMESYLNWQRPAKYQK